MYWRNDESYSVSEDSTTWTNDRLCFHTATEYDNVAYPAQRYYYFTVFAETNDVFAAKDIHNLEDLKAYAKSIYDPIYPEDANVTDPTDRRNSLNRFVAYHVLNRYAHYYGVTAVDGENSTLAKNFDRSVMDISDWYETMMPYSTMKFSFPNGTEEGLYINRRGVQDRADAQGVKIRGAKVMIPEVNNIDINGLYYYVDDIVFYDQQALGGELWRVDATTLSPDFMRLGTDGQTARGHWTRSSIENGKYAEGGGSPNAVQNTRTCVGFKAGFVENFEFNDMTHLHVRPRTLNFWSYAGDEVTLKGLYDVTIKLPPLPNGEYEIRQGICTGFESWGAVQYYLDGELQSEFVPLCLGGNTLLTGELGRVTYNAERHRFSSYETPIQGFINANLIVTSNLQTIVNPETHMQEGRSYQIYCKLEDVLIDVYQKMTYNEEWQYYETTETTLTNHATGEAISMEQLTEWQNQAYEQAIDLFGEFLKADTKNWMEGPSDYYPGGMSETSQPFSKLSNTLRRVVGRIKSDGHTDHYLRIRQMMEFSSELPLDYFEFVPVSLLDQE